MSTTRAAHDGSPPSSAADALCTPGARSLHGWLSSGAAESARISIGSMRSTLQPFPAAALGSSFGGGEDLLAGHGRLLLDRAGAARQRHEALLAAQRRRGGPI